MRIQCPKCGKGGKANDSLAGKKIRCPACKEIFVAAKVEEEVPTFTPDVAPVPAPAPAATPAAPKVAIPQRPKPPRRPVAPTVPATTPPPAAKKRLSPALIVAGLLVGLAVIGYLAYMQMSSSDHVVDSPAAESKMSPTAIRDDLVGQNGAKTPPKPVLPEQVPAEKKVEEQLVDKTVSPQNDHPQQTPSVSSPAVSPAEQQPSDARASKPEYQWKLTEYAEVVKEKFASAPADIRIDLMEGSASKGERNLCGRIGAGSVLIRILMYGNDDLDRVKMEMVVPLGNDPDVRSERLVVAVTADVMVIALFALKAAKMKSESVECKSATDLLSWLYNNSKSGKPFTTEDKRFGPFQISRSVKVDPGLVVVNTTMECVSVNQDTASRNEAKSIPASPRLEDPKSGDADIPNEIHDGIVEEAKKQWPDNFRMQEHTVRRQVESYRAVRKLTATDIHDATLAAIKQEATKNYPANYVMQEYSIKREMEACRAIRDLSITDIPEATIAKIKKDASSDYPGGYVMQEYVIKQQVESWRKLHGSADPSSKDDVPTSERATPTTAEDFIKLGHAKREEGSRSYDLKKIKEAYRQAVLHYTKAIELSPKSADGYRWRGGTKFILGDFSGSESDLKKAMEINPALKDDKDVKSVLDGIQKAKVAKEQMDGYKAGIQCARNNLDYDTRRDLAGSGEHGKPVVEDMAIQFGQSLYPSGWQSEAFRAGFIYGFKKACEIE